MKTKKYVWSLYFLFMIIGQSFAQNEVIKLKEPTIYIPRNETQLLKYVEEAQRDKKYTYCGDFYRRLRYEKDPKKREKLDKQAVKFYKKAMKKGEVEAYHRMVYMYYYGKGIKKDDTKCLELLQQAVDKGYVPAEYNLGMLYLFGKSRLVSKNAERAESLFINIGGTYSKSVRSSSSNFLENNYRKLAIQWLIYIYTKPSYSKNGKKLSIKNAIKWSKRIEDQSIVEKCYDKLSQYGILTYWTQHYPHVFSGLTLQPSYQRIETIDSVFQEIKKHLYMIGSKRLTKLQNTLFDQYLDGSKSVSTQSEAIIFLKEIQSYLQKKSSRSSEIQAKCMERIKTIETNFAHKYTSRNLVIYLEQANKRIRFYPRIGSRDYEAIQKIILGPIDIKKLSASELNKMLPILAQSTWKASKLSKQMIEKGEKVLWEKENDQPVELYLKGILTRWQKYSKRYQLQSFHMVLYQSVKKWKTEEVIEASSDIRFLIPVPEKGMRNAKRLQAEVLGLRDIAKKLDLKYKFLHIENPLLIAQRQICFEAYKQNFTSKTDLNCRADQQHYELKKAYYKSLLSRIRSDYNTQKIEKEMSDFLTNLFHKEYMTPSYKGDRHSYKNLWIFIHEFFLKLTPTERKWIEARMTKYFKEKLCDAMNKSGKIRFHALIRENAQYSIKWHVAHTSPNCIPTWLQTTKQSCSFCTFYEEENPHLSSKYYDSHSALAYAQEIVGEESLIKLLQTLEAKKEPRDEARKAQEKIEEQKDQELRLAEQQARERHSQFLKTIKNGNCVEGYIYYDCKPPFVPKEYYRIKVKGRLTSVSDKEHEYCFIKVTSILGIDVRLRYSDPWKKKGHFWYCQEDSQQFIDKEYQIMKREILSRCY